jgi:hypothetical protein
VFHCAITAAALAIDRASEDETFVFRFWADLQFLIVALRRLRLAVQLATRVPQVRGTLQVALTDFDAALPGLRRMRNVGEHIDDYALDAPKRHHPEVKRGELQSGTWDGTTFVWLGHKLDIDVALDAAGKLFRAVQLAVGAYVVSAQKPPRRDDRATGASQ